MTLAHDIANVAQELQLHATDFCEAVHQLRDDMTVEELHTELALLRMTAISMRTQAHTIASYVAPLPPVLDRKSRAANDNTLTLSLT
jgi:hypothetical protein